MIAAIDAASRGQSAPGRRRRSATPLDRLFSHAELRRTHRVHSNLRGCPTSSEILADPRRGSSGGKNAAGRQRCQEGIMSNAGKTISGAACDLHHGLAHRQLDTMSDCDSAKLCLFPVNQPAASKTKTVSTKAPRMPSSMSPTNIRSIRMYCRASSNHNRYGRSPGQLCRDQAEEREGGAET